MAQYKVEESSLTAVADAIREKSGTSGALEFPNGFVSAVENITGGGTPSHVEENDVNFYDYDGTLLYSYTLAEAQALTELPPGTNHHDGLVFDRWGWDLESVKALTYPMDIGAIYDTDDGGAHLHICIEEADDKIVNIVLSKNGTGVGTIEWGDGSTVENVSITTATTFSHTYAEPGKYVIRVCSNDSGLSLGGGSSANTTMGKVGTDMAHRDAFLRRVHVGKQIAVANSAFWGCGALEYATTCRAEHMLDSAFRECSTLQCVSVAATGIGYYVFWNDISLKHAFLPSNLTGAASGCFRDCRSLRRLRTKPNLKFSEGYSLYNCFALQEASGCFNGASSLQSCNVLRSITIGESCKTIPNNTFDGCFHLKKIDIPAVITGIGANAFAYCYNLRLLKFRSTTPPTVSNENAFSGIPTTCVVEVPAGTLANYQAATNYGSIAAQMVEV